MDAVRHGLGSELHRGGRSASGERETVAFGNGTEPEEPASDEEFDGLGIAQRHMRCSQGEKLEVIKVVEDSLIEVKRTHQELRINRIMSNVWYQRYSEL